MGLLLAVVVHPAGIQSRVGVRALLVRPFLRFECLKTVFVDGGYSDRLINWALSLFGWNMQGIKPNSAPTGAGTLAKPGVSAVRSKVETAWMSKKRMGQMHSACAPIRFFEESGVSARPLHRTRCLLGKMSACTHPRRGARPWPAACRWQTQPLPDHTPAWRCAARANG